MNLMKRKYVERLVLSFRQGRDEEMWKCPDPSDQSGSKAPSTSRGKRKATSPPPSSASESRMPKRTKKQSTNDGEDDDQGEDEKGNSQNLTPNTEIGQESCLLFACPFVKRYPSRYHKCYSHLLKDVSRVKQHLRRDKTHLLPIYCPNCSETFSTEDIRDAHVRAATCTRKPQVKWEGITARQREELSKRSLTNSAVENWNDVYRILFPGSPLPSSPYIDPLLSGELRAFREHALSEGPPIWNEILRTHLPENLQTYIEELQSFHHSFFPEAIFSLFQGWNPTNSSTRSLRSRTRPNPTREEPEMLVDLTNATIISTSHSPSRSDPALGSSVRGGIQSQNGSTLGNQDNTGQQQSSAQGGTQVMLSAQQEQPILSFPSTVSQGLPLSPVHETDFLLQPQYSIDTSSTFEHGSLHFPYDPLQDPALMLSSEQSMGFQISFTSTEPDSEFSQSQYHLPSMNLAEGSGYQQNQTGFQPQISYSAPSAVPPTNLPDLGNWDCTIPVQDFPDIGP